MRYTKDYLAKYHTSDINEQSLNLNPLTGPITTGFGISSDIVNRILGPALATAKAAGKTRRADMIKRLSTAGFGGVPSGSDPNYAAIINQLQIDSPGLVQRLAQRVGAQFQQLRLRP